MNASTNSKRLTCFLGRLFVLIIMVSMLIGCKTANYGKFKISTEVDKIFKSGQVLSDHNYYFTGSNVRPTAVMGINKNYTLDDKFWDKANDIQKNLKFWVEWINSKLEASGYYILAPDGKQIGIYYSNRDTGFVRIGENNQVIIALPDKGAGKGAKGDGGGP
ncbi:hypothetical protein ACFLZL_00870 [Thermodesulfobacteriota bacterium]